MVKRADREIRILKNNHVPRFIKMGSSSLVPETGPVLEADVCACKNCYFITPLMKKSCSMHHKHNIPKFM